MMGVGLGFRSGIRVSLRLLLIAVVLGESGCITSRQPGEAYVKDGVPYGVTDGPFRGRWWNYYERARSFQQGGFFEEAERDLRLAMQSRRKDGLWPRTYGMHFIPEYFPHRELGINLYHQGDLSGSIEELEISLAQHYSARAAYQFALAQRQQIEESGADHGAPTLEIRSDREGLSETDIVLSGVARDDTFVSAIEIDGQPYDLRLVASEVPFSVPYVLRSGTNTARIRVTDIVGKVYDSEVHFENDLDGPAVSFDEPIVLPGVVTGQVFDPSGVVAMTVDGQEARLVEKEGGVMAFEVAVSTDGSLGEFFCLDSVGNKTMGVLPGRGGEADGEPPALALASRSAAVAAELLSDALGSRLAASVVKEEPVGIRLENVLEGGAYYQDDIFVSISAWSNEPIEEVSFLGEVLPVVPARNKVYITQRVRLDSGPNELVASILDVQGNNADVRRRVLREENALEVLSNRLAVVLQPEALPGDDFVRGVITMLGDINVTTKYGIGEDVGRALAHESIKDRFDVLNRDPEKLAIILREQGLSAELSSRERALQLGEFIPFEAMLTLMARTENDSLELIVESVSAEKNTSLSAHVDVAGHVDDADALVERLAVRLLQEFPRAQGAVTGWESFPKLSTGLTKLQGTRRYQKCLLYTLVDAPNGTRQPNVVAEGFVTGAGSGGSSVEITKSLEEEVPLESLPIGEGYHVVLK